MAWSHLKINPRKRVFFLLLPQVFVKTAYMSQFMRVKSFFFRFVQRVVILQRQGFEGKKAGCAGFDPFKCPTTNIVIVYIYTITNYFYYNNRVKSSDIRTKYTLR